ncbi:MAG: M23 family metallopeptidase [Bacteroidales bacterium]|nr:M23 family metallopeptidase [Bacteroidales bacterium]MBN2697400.1 M23 family metallopeptidase [Bacteroidales bacterium]
MRLLLFLLSASSICSILHAQDRISFAPPVKIPIILSGNFGEIRSDHFHSGIDIKTNGRPGYPVYAIEEGYISRLKVQANGYGKTVYVTHDNGFTSVYGHLDRYRDDVAGYVRENQYRLKSFGVDLFPEKNRFRVKKNELIAFTGNTGSSSGPHLHFEVRKTGGQVPTNVLKYDFPIPDTRKPVFYRVFIYPQRGSGIVNQNREKVLYNVTKTNGDYGIENNGIPEVYGELGIGTEVFDFLDGTPNRCGVYSLELHFDNRMVYKHQMDQFSFSETRYINAHIDYEQKISNNIKAHKLFRLPNDRLSIYEHLEKDGILSIRDSNLHTLKIIARDVAGNESQLLFRMKGTPPACPLPSADTGIQTLMSFNRENQYSDDGLRLSVPVNALYEDLPFKYSRKPGFEGLYSDIFSIHHEAVPLHRPFLLSIKPVNLPEELKEKALIVSVGNNQSITSSGGAYRDGMIETEARNFGNYAIALDTIAPVIVPLNTRNSADYRGSTSIDFTISDDLSGIDRFEGYIDNTWVLFEYDLKNNLISYAFDDRMQSDGSVHDLELYVSDLKGNATLYHTTFTR